MSSTSSMSPSGLGPLPLVAVPRHYSLRFQPFIDKSEFEGHVDININIKKISNIITIHAQDLNIYNVKLQNTEDVEPVYFKVLETKYNVNMSTVDIILDHELSAGKEALLSMAFKGNISNETNFGLYKSELVNEQNQTQSLFSTHFEPNYARRVFPCWDDPGYKATFDVTLDVPREFTALSNNAVKTVEEKDNRKQFIFKRTPVMSTYTLAFAFGKLESIEKSVKSQDYDTNRIYKVYTLPGYSKLAHFSLDAMVKFVDFFEDYFGIPYNLTKLDLISVPIHPYLAMENWGLITMKHDMVIVDGNSDSYNSRSTLFMIAHEVAHQWIGNLVTMRWWDDYWLNESFATYLGLLAIDKIYPHYQSEVTIYEFYIKYLNNLEEEKLAPVLTKGYQSETYPIETGLTIYGKGAVALNILSQMISEDKFKEIMRSHVMRHQFKSVQASDFISLLPNSNDFNRDQFIKTWIESPNYPYLDVTHNHQTNELIITQLPIKKENPQPLWYIPIELITNENGINRTFTLSNNSISVPISTGTKYKINTNSYGYIRVNYPRDNLKTIVNSKSSLFKSQDHIELIDNIDFYLKKDSQSAKPESKSMVDFIDAFSVSDDLEAISHFIFKFNNFVKLWSNLDSFNKFYKKVQHKWHSHIDLSKKIDWSSKVLIGRGLRQRAILFAALDGNKEVLESAKLAFDRFKNGEAEAVSYDYRSTLFRVISSLEDPKYIDDLIGILKSNMMKSEKFLGTDVVESLGYCQPNLVPKVVEWALKAKPRTLSMILDSLRPDKQYTLSIWEYLTLHWSNFLKLAPEFQIRTLNTVVSNLLLPEDINPIIKFLKGKSNSNLSPVIDSLNKQLAVYCNESPAIENSLSKLSSK